MRILVTGATGYIGKRLIPILIEQGHTVICAVRGKHRCSLLFNSFYVKFCRTFSQNGK